MSKRLSDAQVARYRSEGYASPVDESGAVDMPLKPGQASFHHTYLIHGSNPNRTGERRIGFSVSYIPTRVRQTGAKRSMAHLVRGVDEYGHFE